MNTMNKIDKAYFALGIGYCGIAAIIAVSAIVALLMGVA